MAKKKGVRKESNSINSISGKRSSLLVYDSMTGDQIIIKKKTKRSCVEITLFNMFAVSLFVALSFIIISSFIKYIPTIYSDSELIKSMTDSKLYSIVKLNNGLEAILISDEALKLSAVGLAVNVGGSTDEFPGLAHLSQHMIMQQSANCNRNEFINRLARHTGRYTQEFTDELLSFSFEVGNDAFAQSIREFAEMLYAPIIDKDTLQNEIASIDAEYVANLKNTRLLEEHIIHQVAFNDSEYFPNGNRLSFSKRSSDELIEQIKQFIAKYYTGSNMRLAVLSNCPISKLKGFVIKHFQYFNSTPPLEVNRTVNSSLTRKGMTLGKIIKYKVKFGAYLNVIFFFDRIEQGEHSESYLRYMQYLLRSRKKGSLSFLLKKSLFITSMTSSYDVIDQTLIKFTINFQLTQSGEINIYNIAKQVFNYLRIIRDSKPNEELFNEIMRINTLRFNFDSFPKEYFKYVKEFAVNMFQFKNDIRKLSMGKHFLREYNESIIKHYINQFKVENCLLLYGSEYNFTSEYIAKLVKNGRAFDLKWTKEKWYETSFVFGDLTSTVITNLNAIDLFDRTFTIRAPNNYISKLNYTKDTDPLGLNAYNDSSPVQISNSSHINVWYKVNRLLTLQLDKTFHVPKVMAYIYIVTPIIRSFRDYPLNLMIYQYVKLSIEEELEDIRVSGNSIEAKESEK